MGRVLALKKSPASVRVTRNSVASWRVPSFEQGLTQCFPAQVMCVWAQPWRQVQGPYKRYNSSGISRRRSAPVCHVWEQTGALPAGVDTGCAMLTTHVRLSATAYWQNRADRT
jgi:hypothetical protein